MTNKEKYADKLIELAVNGEVFGLKNGEPKICAEIRCKECDFGKSDSCECSAYGFRKWLNSEYVEPPVDWSKVAVDTPILVRDFVGGEWSRRYFAKYENGIVYAWENGATSWSAHRSNITDWKMAKLAESEDYALIHKFIMESKPKTNADMIRNMSDEKLALSIMCPADLGFNKECECNGEMNRNCRKCTLNWLQQEAE